MAIECSYYLEPVDTTDLPRRFLDAFAAVLSHSNYAMVLDAACRVTTRCGRCTSTCPVYQVTGEERDIPCMRSELLLKIYRRYFTAAGSVAARFGASFKLDETYINKLAEEVHGLSPLQARVPDGNRSRTLDPPLALDLVRGRHRAQGNGCCDPRAA
jgi:hypothetical protein